ncbi:hypothetical protein G6F56_010375 [Rhizopus delemar]|nr:hypothetical protein G6F56_010375 [Rhizopus delemar]
MKEPPVLAFLDIKSAYDTVDRAIIWRALETHISTPLLGILQCLFDDVSIQVLLGGHSSPSFWPRTGVLQGSILSPFLYSIYINSLPELLRSITLPVSSRYFSTMPRRQFGGLWLNCLLYADDVVILGSPEVVRRLLKKAEEHSFSLGYRWNPEKCVVLNCPSQHQAAPYKLYGSAIPSASIFPYLGVPFNSEGAIDTNLLIQRNTASAVSSMRAILQPLGLRSPSFSRLTAARLYTTFIRPKFEYGLCISTFYNYQLDRLEKAQDQCLRIAFGGHQRSSTGVFKHLTNLPSMRARIHTLVLKFIIRFHYLPEDALLPILVPFLNAAPKASRFQWPALCESNPIWSNPEFTGGFTADDRLDYFSTPTNVKSSVLAYRSSQLTIAYNRPRPPVLLMACRPYLGIDPILLIPMSVYDRSRILRWRMGWLPGRPRQCRCGHPQASRSHLLSCLRVARRLNVALNTQTNPLDYVLNQLPKKIPSQHSPTLFTRWSFWWPIICCIMFEIEKICLDDTEFSAAAADTSGSLFLHTLKPATQSQTLIADMTESLLLESD